MNRIQQLFDRQEKEILNIYFTAGFPHLESTGEIILALDKAGANLIEIGMPYSDPLADGPTIQQSGQVALQNGMTLPILFDQIAAIRTKTSVPLILMGYFNQVIQYGEMAFFEKCKEVGVDGLILPDLPLDVYEEDYQTAFQELDLGITFLITPQTAPPRIRKVDALSRGFIYMVSNASITGAKTGISDQQLDYFNRIKEMDLENPRLIGFGISSHDTFQTACQYARGAIIGSAFIKQLEAASNKELALDQAIESFVKGILNSPVAASNHS